MKRVPYLSGRSAKPGKASDLPVGGDLPPGNSSHKRPDFLMLPAAGSPLFHTHPRSLHA